MRTTASTFRSNDTARAVFDRAYNGTGNWAFNVAYSGSLGFAASWRILRNLDHAQRLDRTQPSDRDLVLVERGRAARRAARAVRRTSGRALRIHGDGDCAINDPAAPNVRVVYPRAAIESIWQRNEGVAYVIAPDGIDYASILEAPAS